MVVDVIRSQIEDRRCRVDLVDRVIFLAFDVIEPVVQRPVADVGRQVELCIRFRIANRAVKLFDAPAKQVALELVDDRAAQVGREVDFADLEIVANREVVTDI